mgnify:CR=1 FL=1
MSVEVGSIVEGVVTGITNFGAFVDLGNNKTGLIHISEVSDVYVKDIREFLKEGDKVTAKVITLDNGKVGLSLKQLIPKTEEVKPFSKPSGFRGGYDGQERRSSRSSVPVASFEDKLSKFIKDSDERLLDLKRHTEARRGGRGAGRKG